MSIMLRIVLIMVSAMTFIAVIRKIRQAKVQIEDSIFWVILSAMLLFISLCPQIVYWFSERMGIISPSNFVFLLIIFILMIKIFRLSLRISQMESRLKDLVQLHALNEEENREQNAKTMV